MAKTLQDCIDNINHQSEVEFFVTKHILERVDEREIPIKTFQHAIRSAANNYGRMFAKRPLGSEAVIYDESNNLVIPFVKVKLGVRLQTCFINENYSSPYLKFRV